MIESDSKEFNRSDWCGSGSEIGITSDQWSSKALCEHKVGGIISGEVVAELPDLRKEEVMRIPVEAEIQQVLQRLIGTTYGNGALAYETAEYLRNFEIQEMRSMQRFVA